MAQDHPMAFMVSLGMVNGIGPTAPVRRSFVIDRCGFRQELYTSLGNGHFNQARQPGGSHVVLLLWAGPGAESLLHREPQSGSPGGIEGELLGKLMDSWLVVNENTVRFQGSL